MRSSPLHEVETALDLWVKRCATDGWLSAEHAAALAAVERRGSADLFLPQERKPLVVGFFGGTGAGKSSLLNRIAGDSVARVGVERPTSHEVTLYVHEAVALAELPSELPLAQVRVAQHSSDAWREVMWVDAPDLDSVDEQNRRCTLAWLPHLDVLVYVVSPERYRDDVGWRVLLERRERHGWVFVMNRCDEGGTEALDDFRRMLAGAGFEQPVLVPTSCLRGGHACDEFETLLRMLNEARVENAGEAIRLQAERTRATEVRRLVESWHERFGTPALWDQARRALNESWDQVRRLIEEGTEYAVTLAAHRIAARNLPDDGLKASAGRLIQNALAKRVGWEGAAHASRQTAMDTAAGGKNDIGLPPKTELRALVAPVWDEWSAAKLTTLGTAAEVQLQGRGIAPGPAVAALERVNRDVSHKVQTQLEDHLRRALAQPGTRWQRAARRVTGFLTILLPGAALCWVAFAAVLNFQRGVSGAAGFAGTDFLVSAVMLVLVAWALPFAADRLLKPSLERSAATALRAGRAQALAETGAQFERGLVETGREAEERWREAKGLLERLEGTGTEVSASTAPVRRLFAAPAGVP